MQFNSVKDVLIHWRERHSDKPISWFAKRVGVSHSTIQRIMDGNTKNPDFPTGRSICLNALEKQEDAFELLKVWYPDKVKYITEDAKSFQKVQHFKDPLLLSAYNDFYKWQILYLTSSCDVPITAFEKLGPVYSKKAIKLCSEGLIELKEGVFSFKGDLGHVICPELLTKTVGHIARSLQEKSEREDPDQEGHVYFSIESLSVEGKANIKKLLLNTSQQISEMIKITSRKGEKPVAIMITLSDLV